MKYLSEHERLRPIFRKMRIHRESSYLELIEATFRPYVSVMSSLKDNLEEKMDELEQQSKRLTMELVAYADQCLMNDNFYM